MDKKKEIEFQIIFLFRKCRWWVQLDGLIGANKIHNSFEKIWNARNKGSHASDCWTIHFRDVIIYHFFLFLHLLICFLDCVSLHFSECFTWSLLSSAHIIIIIAMSISFVHNILCVLKITFFFFVAVYSFRVNIARNSLSHSFLQFLVLYDIESIYFLSLYLIAFKYNNGSRVHEQMHINLCTECLLFCSFFLLLLIYCILFCLVIYSLYSPYSYNKCSIWLLVCRLLYTHHTYGYYYIKRKMRK